MDESLGMRRRIEALGPTKRANLFRGAVLASDEDEELQRLVEEAADACGAPMALVSLVLDRIQFFRAHHGLPADLALARATDRDTSFCQLVVRDEGELVVEQAASDARVPQELVEQYGISAYVGVPLRVDGAILGTLCVIDVESRSFDAEARERLRALAEAVSQRLEALAATQHRPLDIAVRPVFAELRNALSPLVVNTSMARLSFTELAPLARLAAAPEQPDVARALSVLTTARRAIEDLSILVEELDESCSRVVRLVGALEAALMEHGGRVRLRELLAHADQLSLHQTRVVGGVRWPEVAEEREVQADRRAALAEISALLVIISAVAYGQGYGDGLTVLLDDEAPTLRIELPPVPREELERALLPLLTASEGALRLEASHVAFDIA